MQCSCQGRPYNPMIHPMIGYLKKYIIKILNLLLIQSDSLRKYFAKKVSLTGLELAISASNAAPSELDHRSCYC